MDAIEMMNFVNSASIEMMEMLSIKSKNDFENCLNKLRGELKSRENCEELKEFISKSNDLLSILEGGEYSGNVKKESFCILFLWFLRRKVKLLKNILYVANLTNFSCKIACINFVHAILFICLIV